MTGSTTVAAVKEALAALLSRELPQVQVVNGYSGQQYFGRLAQPVLNITIRELEAASQSFGEHLGFYSGTGGTVSQVKGSLGKATFGLTLQLPWTGAGADADQYALKIFELLQGSEEFSFLSLRCGELQFREEIQAFCLEMTTQAELFLVQEEQAAVIQSIEVKGDCAG